MLSVIIPALNEASAIESTLRTIRSSLTEAAIPHEIIVVNDGSTDQTGALAAPLADRVLHHPIPGGYGRSIKDGILHAKYDVIAITDADGTYPNERIIDLYREVVEGGYDMAVGARTGKEYWGTFLKMPARLVFLWLCEYTTGRKIADINSGLRVFYKQIPLKYWGSISNSFSFTTTITLACLHNGYFVKYLPVDYYQRQGHSHVNYWRDTIRSLQIIVENILYYNPLKLFLLVVWFLMGISGLSWIGWMVSIVGKRQNFFEHLSIGCFQTAFIVAAIGLAATLNKKRPEPEIPKNL